MNLSEGWMREYVFAYEGGFPLTLRRVVYCSVECYLHNVYFARYNYYIQSTCV